MENVAVMVILIRFNDY